jgi:hypothetical protein
MTLANTTNVFTAEARKEARARLRSLIATMTDDLKLGDECASLIHVPVCGYCANLQDSVVSAEKIKGVIVPKVHRLAGGAIESLERLERTGRAVIDKDNKQTRYRWAKAWRERTTATHEALLDTGKPVPMMFDAVPSPDEILPLIPAAKASARKNTADKTRRDASVVAVLKAYARLSGSKPPLSRSPNCPTLKFLGKIEACYGLMLPNGFGVSRSHRMLEKLRDRALASA